MEFPEVNVLEGAPQRKNIYRRSGYCGELARKPNMLPKYREWKISNLRKLRYTNVPMEPKSVEIFK
ncbi:hypothetical protein Taro_009876 [Colocasia esculenta]|uniref:Uncharacterized protein n=1 Tax=Colocasia esculenta TaxID=4460 RepID=A0A843U636_COLES|nr:hypothetical protein [Colocasia esculenta]